MMKAKANLQNKLMRILVIPIKALAKARDSYVKSMNTYADKVHCSVGPGFGSAGYSVPRSFSTNSMRSSSNDDFKELIRAASTSTLGNRIDLTSSLSEDNSQPQKQVQIQGRINSSINNNYNNKVIKGVPRSASVGMAMIEEDKPCDFDEINHVNGMLKKDDQKMNKEKFRMFPRSRSYAVGSTSTPIPSMF